jgi:Zn-dependent peptidase ImmA (M78 family)
MKLRPKDFKAPYITQGMAWEKADGIRVQHWPSSRIPVEVEEILWKVGLRLEPLESLKEAGDVDALLRGDLTSIIVDNGEYMDDRMQNRIRFSIAHELGHFVLHSDIYREMAYESIKEWIEFVRDVPETQWSFFEMQAYEFAGRLLVPLSCLKSRVEAAVRKAEEAGFNRWDKSGDAAREYMASPISRAFGVSSQVIEKRIIREGLLLPKAQAATRIGGTGPRKKI